jgi:hypothetical protein
MDNLTVLRAIGLYDTITFQEFCRKLGGECPRQRGEWAGLFQVLDSCEDKGLVIIDRFTDGKVNQLALEQNGREVLAIHLADLAARKDTERGLLNLE